MHAAVTLITFLITLITLLRFASSATSSCRCYHELGGEFGTGCAWVCVNTFFPLFLIVLSFNFLLGSPFFSLRIQVLYFLHSKLIVSDPFLPSKQIIFVSPFILKVLNAKYFKASQWKKLHTGKFLKGLYFFTTFVFNWKRRNALFLAVM